MTTKAAFNAEDWSIVTSAPALTGLLMASAGRGGAIRESVAMSRAYAESRQTAVSQLMREVLSSPAGGGTGSAATPRTPEELERFVLARLRHAIRLLDLGAEVEEVNEYKRFVYGIAEAVANAHKEGGFLGVGGTRVSEREQGILDKVAALFDEPPVLPEGAEEAAAPEEGDAAEGWGEPRPE